MTLPSTGPISLADVNVEIQKTSTSLITMNDTLVRTVAGITTPATTISMSNLLGKSYETFYDFAGTWYGTNISQTGNCQFRINTNLNSTQYAPLFSSLNPTGKYLYVSASTNTTTNTDSFAFFLYNGTTTGSGAVGITSVVFNPKLHRVEFYSNDGVLRVSYIISLGMTLDLGFLYPTVTIPSTSYNPTVATPGTFRVVTRG